MDLKQQTESPWKIYERCYDLLLASLVTVAISRAHLTELVAMNPSLVNIQVVIVYLNYILRVS